jgi:hypothetical protein
MDEEVRREREQCGSFEISASRTQVKLILQELATKLHAPLR